jgi:hypothetical protein
VKSKLKIVHFSSSPNLNLSTNTYIVIMQCVVIGKTDALNVAYIETTNLTFGKFISQIRRKLSGIVCTKEEMDQPGSPNMNTIIQLETREDVENMLFVCFGHSNLRFVRFENVI